MSDGPEKEYDWATDGDPFFTFLGLYVAAFQSIEGTLDEIILLNAGFENRSEAFSRLAGMRHQDRIDAVSDITKNSDRFPRMRENEDWWECRSSRVIDGLHAERERRNSILHSKFWLRGLEAGMSAIRTDNKRSNGELVQHVEEMTRAKMDEILKEIAMLAFDTGQLHLQLIHWYPHEERIDRSGR
jgi:hypothetical protein